MELLLIRHGLPLRVEKRDGTPADPPLSPSGLAQAESLAQWLEGEKIDRIYSSPLRRARQTAEPLALLRGMEIEIEDGVAELDAHSEYYIPLEELKRTDYARWQAFVSGGYGSQSEVDAFSQLVAHSIERIIVENPGRRVAIFCHGGVVNCWAAHVLGLRPQLFFDAAYTSMNRFMASSRGQRSLASLNEAPHLRSIPEAGGGS
jgi:probable phosphoglycerate mutase